MQNRRHRLYHRSRLAKRIMIARKNHLTALHGLCSVDTSASSLVSLRCSQRIASYASRYGKICRVMRPFCGALNRMMGRRLNPHVCPLHRGSHRYEVLEGDAMFGAVQRNVVHANPVVVRAPTVRDHRGVCRVSARRRTGVVLDKRGRRGGGGRLRSGAIFSRFW